MALRVGRSRLFSSFVSWCSCRTENVQSTERLRARTELLVCGGGRYQAVFGRGVAILVQTNTSDVRCVDNRLLSSGAQRYGVECDRCNVELEASSLFTSVL